MDNDENSVLTEEEISMFNDSDSSIDELFRTDLVIYKTDQEHSGDLQLDTLTVLNSSVAGCYASADYIFADGLLNIGAYELKLFNSYEEEDIIRKYSEVYGEPAIVQEFKFNENAEERNYLIAAWVDSEDNIIVIDINRCHEDDADAGTISSLDDLGDDDFIIYLNDKGKLMEQKQMGYFLEPLLSEIKRTGNFDGI